MARGYLDELCRASEALTGSARRLLRLVRDGGDPAQMELTVRQWLSCVRVCCEQMGEASRFVGELTCAEGFLQDSVSPLRFVGNVFRLEAAVLEEELREPFQNLTARIAELEPQVAETMSAQARVVCETRSVLDLAGAELERETARAETSIERAFLELAAAPEPGTDLREWADTIARLVIEGEIAARESSANAFARLKANDEELSRELDRSGSVEVQSLPLGMVRASVVAALRRTRDVVQPLAKRAPLSVPLDRLVRQMRLISLNAQLQSAKSGRGIGLDVLAARAAGVSLETAQLAGLVASRIDEFAERMKRISAALDGLARDGERQMKAPGKDLGGVRECLEDLKREAARRRAALEPLLKDGNYGRR